MLPPDTKVASLDAHGRKQAEWQHSQEEEKQ